MKWTRALMGIAIAAILASGCIMIPTYERPLATIAPNYPGEYAVDGDVSAADLGWREVFSDERLRNIIDLALANNSDFRMAALRVEQTRAQYRVTRSESFPPAAVSASFTRAHAAERTADSWSANIALPAYELDFFGRIRSLNRQALEKYLATAEAKRSAQISLVSEVSTQYFTLRQAQAQLDLAHQTLSSVEESYALNKATFEAGARSELDLRTAESQVNAAQINILSYERRAAEIQNLLVLLVGQPLPADLPDPQAFDSAHLVADVPPGIPSDLVERRPDIIEAEHSLKAANANIGAARAAFFPAIQFTGSLGAASAELGDFLGAGTTVWSLSPQITAPIFTGGRNRANLNAAKIATQIEIADYQKTIQVAFREVADALVDVEAFGAQLGILEKQIQTQQRRFDLATLRYRQGEDSYLNLLSAQRDLYSAQQSYLETTLAKLTSQVSLYSALGGGWK